MKISDLSTQRAPRYTSYPTAVQFTPDVGAEQAAGWLAQMPVGDPLSLYLHVPFCREVCWYCACNMKLAAREETVRGYAANLIREIDLVGDLLPARMHVAHLHWGGGTPTSMPRDCMASVMAKLRDRFNVLPGAEIAFELDPRTFAPGTGEFLADLGATRASLGVQEFDAKVQAAVNRIQPFDKVAETVAELRDAGIRAINFDLIYGLPFQSVETITRTVEQTVKLLPDRIALFGYAHVPWMSKRQRLIPEEALPGSEERFEQAETAARLLVENRYERIGLDHFARPADRMAVACREKRLRRNFQGYTDDSASNLIGFGSTAISSVAEGYFQNIAETGAWARAVVAGELPVARGVALTADDRLRRDVISDLMCHLEADLEAITAKHGCTTNYFADELCQCQAFADVGHVEIEGARIRVADSARPILRVIASVFDAHLRRDAETPRHVVAV